MKSSKKDENFSLAWENWVKSVIEDVIDQADTEYKNYVSFELCDFKAMKKKCSEDFHYLRDELKKIFYGPNIEDLNSKRLSFAKLASVLCKTLIQNKVVKFDVAKAEEFRIKKNISNEDTDWLVKNVLINYRIAFYSSISFLYHSMEYTYFSNGKIELLQKLKDLETLYIYKLVGCIQGFHEKFDNYIIVNFARRDREKQDFDFITFSALLCGLQEFNDLILRNNIDYLNN